MPKRRERIYKELQFPVSPSFVETFFGTSQKVFLRCSLEFSKVSDVHHLSLCLCGATPNSGETQIMEEDRQQEDALFDWIITIIITHFRSPVKKKNKLPQTGLISANDIKTKKKPPGIPDNQWLRFQELYCKVHRELTKTSQHALGVIFFEGDEKRFYVPTPHFRDKNSGTEVHVHTEEILILDIDKCLEKYKQNNGPKVESIVIYTYNSPCLKREKEGIDACMFLLIVKAQQWQCKYGIQNIYVLFTKPWGPFVPRFFKDQSSLHTYNNMSFQLDSKKLGLKKNDEKQFLSMVEDKDKNNLRLDFKNAKDDLIKMAKTTKSLTIKDHLCNGNKEINQYTFHPKAEKQIRKHLSSKWQEFVESSALEHIRAALAEDYNAATVECFLQNLESIIGNKSPIMFYQIPQEFLTKRSLCSQILKLYSAFRNNVCSVLSCCQ